jgi:hypothetical protein
VAAPVRDDGGGDGVAVSGAAEARTYGGRTAWARNLGAPVRDFLSTQTGGAAVMALATLAALVWANSPWWHAYESVWSTALSVRIGSAGIAANLRVWVNEGLMTSSSSSSAWRPSASSIWASCASADGWRSRCWRRSAASLVPVAIYLGVQRRRRGRTWLGGGDVDRQCLRAGCARAAHTAVGDALACVLLTLSVVDDLCALVVIAIVYTAHVSLVALAVAVGLFGVLVGLRRVGPFAAPLTVAVAVALWVAMFKSGIDPVISGLAVGLATGAYHPRARTWSAASRWRTRFASSRRRSWRAPHARVCCRRSRPTSDSSTACTRGRAT